MNEMMSNPAPDALAVLDLFSAAAGGWSLGMHRAGFHTVAACEFISWRRALYLQNNPGVRMYDDVSTLTGAELLRDLGFLPSIVVGSPPCQDISSANTKGKGVEGERSGLYFEAIRVISEIRDLGRERGESAARWIALENSANLRTRGADAVLAALEAIGYTCWAFVVSAGDIGANHERARSWIIGCDLDQIADSGCWLEREQSGRRNGQDGPSLALDGIHDQKRDSIGPGHVCEHGIRWPWACDPCDAAACAAENRQHPGAGLSGSDERDEPADNAGNAAQDGWREGRSGRCAEPASGLSIETCGHAVGTPPDADQAGQADGRLVPCLRSAQEPDDGCCDVADADGEGQPDGAVDAEMGWGESFGGDAAEPWAEWNGGLAGHLRLDDGLSAWVAQSRIAVGGPRGTAAASLIVEAFGDAVVPQIPEAIGRAILRTEQALQAVYGRSAA